MFLSLSTLSLTVGCGVGYMVLSRVRRSHDLFVANFRKDLVYAHPEAIKYAPLTYAEEGRGGCRLDSGTRVKLTWS